MELSLQFLKLSLSRIACFFMWFRVRSVALIGVNSVFFLFFFLRWCDVSSFLFSRFVRRILYSFRAFSRRFYASLRRFFFVVLHLYKEIYKLIISRGKRSGGCTLFSGFAGVRDFLKAIGCVMQRMTVRTFVTRDPREATAPETIGISISEKKDIYEYVYCYY